GIVGLSATAGDIGLMDATVLVPGVAQSMSAERFRAALKASEALHRTIDRYAVSLLRHLSQTVACNRLHTLDQRAARWLLLTGPPIGRINLPLTQEAVCTPLPLSS